MAAIPLPLGSYRLAAPAASCRQLVNCYAEAAPADAPRGQPAILVRAPGIAALADTGESEVRGFTKLGETLFACAGDAIYSVSSGGTATALTGTAISGNGPVRMTNNGTDIVVAPGNGDAFSSDGSTVAQITDPDFIADGGGADPSVIDSYTVFRRPGAATFINSGLGDLTFAGLDIATAEGAPGNLVGLLPNNRELVMVKEDSSELWYNAGNATGSPFSRSPDGFKELGCAAGRSLCAQDNSAFMLATDRTVRRLSSVWQRVSQHGVESVIQAMGVVSDCIALPYSQTGHFFIAFTFPSAGRTFVLDLTTGEWHERESQVGSASVGSWRVQAITQAYGKQIVGDRLSGKIGYLDPDTRTEWGETQVMTWTYQPVYAEAMKASHRRLEIGLTAGQGLASGQGEDPLLTLYVSDDGGNTFRARPTRSIGAMGQYRKRVVYWNLGESSQRVYRCRVSDPVRLFTLDTQLDADGVRR